MRRLKGKVLGAVAIAMFAMPAMADDKLKVVTTFTIIADMARNVAGDAADVVSITQPWAEIHGYSPTPKDLVQAQDADLILWNGLNLESWFAQFLDNLGDVPAATLTEGIEPIAISGGSYDGKANPHAWMGLDNAMIYIDNIQKALSQNDPKNAALYAKNAEAYKQRIREALEPARAEIQRVPEDKRWLVTCEGAFSYLARDYGMHELFLWPINADQMGTPRQIRMAIDTIREHDLPAVFCESTVSQAPARQLDRETDAVYGGMLYVDSLSTADGPVPTYLDLLRVTSETIAEGLKAGLRE